MCRWYPCENGELGRVLLRPGQREQRTRTGGGSFLDLVVGQPSLDPQYAGATTARWIDGLGITCDNVPAGFTEQGSKDGYPFCAKG